MRHTFDPERFARDLARHRTEYDRLFAICELRDLEAFARAACAHIPTPVVVPARARPARPLRHTTSFRTPRAPLMPQPVRVDTLDDYLAPRASREPVPDGCGDWSRGHARLHGAHTDRAAANAYVARAERAALLAVPEVSHSLRARQRGHHRVIAPEVSQAQAQRVEMFSAVLAALHDEPPPEPPVPARVSGKPRSKRSWVRFAG